MILQLRVVDGTIKLNSAAGALLATVSSASPGAPPLQLDISFYESGIARVRITEKDERTPRWEVSATENWKRRWSAASDRASRWPHREVQPRRMRNTSTESSARY